MKRSLLSPAVLPSLPMTGCAVWTRPGTTEAAFRRDLADCEYEATLATANMVPGPAQTSNKSEVTEQCMRKKGYYHKQPRGVGNGLH